MAHKKGAGSSRKDDTLFATIDGVVQFEYARGGRRRVSVLPQESQAA
jgi:ribosomal protein L27